MMYSEPSTAKEKLFEMLVFHTYFFSQDIPLLPFRPVLYVAFQSKIIQIIDNEESYFIIYCLNCI